MAGPSSDQLLPSPTLSASTSSYDLVSDCSLSSTASQSFHLVSEDSGDEIVWSISDLSISSDDNYVAHSPTQASSSPIVEGLQPNAPVTAPGRSLETALNSPVIRPSQRETRKVKSAPSHSPGSPAVSGKQEHKKKNVQTRPPTQAYPSPAPSPQTTKVQKPTGAPATPTPKVPHKALNEDAFGLGARSIVDDYSDKQSIISYDDESVGLPTVYEEASTFISSYVLFDYFLSS